MKTRFTTLDICASLSEINLRAVGLRLVNVYDLDNKTYLFKLSKPDLKLIVLIESGVRIHLSEFDWPKNMLPSGFAMKLRKHLRGRRLISASQLGSDRIVDLQFGSDEAAFHVILELYDRGNIALTDHQDIILTLLRFRRDAFYKEQVKNEENDDVRFAVHEPYPRHAARPVEPLVSIERLREIFAEAPADVSIKRFLIPHLPYGAACIDHCLSIASLDGNKKIGKDVDVDEDLKRLHHALHAAEDYVQNAKKGNCEGYIIQKREKKTDGEFLANVEFHPFLFEQHKHQPYKQFPSFNQAVDEFYSLLETQKNDLKALQRERAALRKLDNVRKDHDSRLQILRNEQDEDKKKALIIEGNLELVDQAIRVICSAIANQVDWDEIKSLVLDAQTKGDTVALAIKSLKLETNSMIMLLSEPSLEYVLYDSFSSSEEMDEKPVVNKKPIKVEIDLSLSAYANAQKYYNKKRQAAQKEQRTIDASEKAFKSAEKKTMQSLKEASIITNIQKARKLFWFEKFLWFISSENFLVLGGRDAQQNEILVKKYLKPGDVYVHADLHGATSCIIKNNTGLPAPPKTLNEAGTMAICHSAAWDAKVVTSAWWVYHHQVSKTAPSGEYLTTGSFLIRGKKNYLPPSYLIYGFGFLFKVDETCIWKHKGERKVRVVDDDLSSVSVSTAQMEDIAILSDESSGSKNEGTPSVVHEITEEQISLVNANEKESKGFTDPGSQILDAGLDIHIETETVDDVQKTIAVAEEDSSSEDERSTKNLSSNTGAEISVEEKEHFKEEPHFPDTLIKMDFRSHDKYNLDALDDEDQEENDGILYLGDNKPVVLNANKENEKQSGKARMSAKQKRAIKKQDNQKSVHDTLITDVLEADESLERQKSKPQNQPNLPYVRGQKKKLAKMRRKQDFDEEEEEKKLMMEMLQAARPGKEKSKKKREKKNASAKPPMRKEPNQQKPRNQSNQGSRPGKPTEIDQKMDSDEERELALKEEHLNTVEVNNALDSLTGIPANDDILLFAIPVCAPYNTMQNYKYKVKLVPGTGKKGRAAKTAISMFQASRDITAQEKDHIRSVKETIRIVYILVDVKSNDSSRIFL